MIWDQDARFGDVLDECCQRVRRGEILQDCLADYPSEYHEELTRLVPLAEEVGQLGRNPSLEFQTGLERRLLAEVDQARQAQRKGFLGRLGAFFTGIPTLRLAVIVLAALVVFAGTGVGVIQASDKSLPDSPLYHVKTAREWAELVLARNGETRLGVQARQIAQRGRELESAVQTGRQRPLIELLSISLATSSSKIVDQALQLRAQGKPEPANRALTVIRGMARHVDLLRAQASPNVRPPLRRLRGALERQEQRLADAGAEDGQR